MIIIPRYLHQWSWNGNSWMQYFQHHFLGISTEPFLLLISVALTVNQVVLYALLYIKSQSCPENIKYKYDYHRPLSMTVEIKINRWRQRDHYWEDMVPLTYEIGAEVETINNRRRRHNFKHNLHMNNFVIFGHETGDPQDSSHIVSMFCIAVVIFMGGKLISGLC